MKVIKLREGKERSLLRRHPWLYPGAISDEGIKLIERLPSGHPIAVCDAKGQFLAWACGSPRSSIRLRAWSFQEKEPPDAALIAKRVSQAFARRRAILEQSNARRMVFAEADGLPGLIVDRYGDTLVAQFLSSGTERWKPVLADALLAQTGCTRLYERSDSGVRSLEGLPAATGWLRRGAADPESTELTIQEHDWRLTLDIAQGHKTGFYLDQRDSRKKFADYTRRLQFQRVLNCYCYTGGFTVAALAGGAAHVTSIDSSGPAIERAKSNIALNGFDATRTTMMEADVNASLRQFYKDGQTFDAIVLDPPKFAPSAAHADRAARAYKDINRLAFKILEPGGVLFTYSCSGGIGAELFHKIVASAGTDAGVDGYISERMQGAPDHPMTLTFPEGEYLKGLVVMKTANLVEKSERATMSG